MRSLAYLKDDFLSAWQCQHMGVVSIQLDIHNLIRSNSFGEDQTLWLAFSRVSICTKQHKVECTEFFTNGHNVNSHLEL